MASWAPKGGAVQFDIIAGRDHFTLPANASRDGDPARQSIHGFINDRLNGVPPTTGIAIVHEDGSRENIDLTEVALTYEALLAIVEDAIAQSKKR